MKWHTHNKEELVTNALFRRV